MCVREMEMGRYENTSETPAAMPRSSVTSPCTRGNSFGLPFEPERRQKVLCNADVKSSGCEGEERQSVGDSDRARPDLYKKEAEIFMDVSVLIGKPLGALRPSPPITAREEVNTRARTHTHRCRRAVVREPERGPCPATLSSPARETALHKTDPPSPPLQHCYNHYQSCYHNHSLWHIWTGTTAQSAKSNTA